MLEADHYYHPRVILRPEELCCVLEGIGSMTPRATPLLARPPTLLLSYAPDPLIVSGPAGNWVPGHTFHCLWR